MFRDITPEETGISSTTVQQIFKGLEQDGIRLHSVLLSRGSGIFAEAYWSPFNAGRIQRIYSCTKSFVGVAIGFLEQEGKLQLSDPITDYFPELLPEDPDPRWFRLTIRNMLMMSTGTTHKWWFLQQVQDRVAFYFRNAFVREPGETFEYDSIGSFVLGALAEKLSGQTLMQYLRDRVLDRIGFSKDARILTCPGGHSWGDSAMLCTTRDMLAFGRFLLNGGAWEGEQLLNRPYVEDMTSDLTGKSVVARKDPYCDYGYGYLIWQAKKGFFLNGMGSQFVICVPGEDVVAVFTADNQGLTGLQGSQKMHDALFEQLRPAMGAPLPEDRDAYRALRIYCAGRTLGVCKGSPVSATAPLISNVTYTAADNPMGIRWFRLCLNGADGILEYENEQGEKSLTFAMGKNAFGFFPEFGYSNEVGEVPTTDGFRYRAAVSAGWSEENRLDLFVQIIDHYMGTLNISFTFDDDRAHVTMSSCAEAFLLNYEGEMDACKA